MSTFLSFKLHIENLLNTKMRALQSNWGDDFRSLNTMFHLFGISHKLSCPYAHQQNGTV